MFRFLGICFGTLVRLFCSCQGLLLENLALRQQVSVLKHAGYGQFAPFEQMSAEDFQAIMDTCFYGVVYTTRAAVPVMRKQKSGHIFQVSSAGGRHAVPGDTPYHAAKWAVGGFSDSLAMEVAPFGVKVCTLEPGGIRTNGARRAVQHAPDLLLEYEDSVGSFLKMLRGLEGRLEGDPQKVRRIHIAIRRLRKGGLSG